MPAYQVAMDIDGRLFVATKDSLKPTWERLQLTPSGMQKHRPIDAIIKSVDRPAWAVDFYLMASSRAAQLVIAD
jgi:hypothetical protein